MIGKAKSCYLLSLLLLLCGGQPGIAAPQAGYQSASAMQHGIATPADGSVLPFQRLVPVEIEKKYPFIHYDSNHLCIGSDSTVLNHLFDKWMAVAATGQGNLNIMHIGSSHVQAGTFPHEVRRNLLQRYADKVADRGMIFPYSAARNCNNPSDYTVHCAQSVDLCRNVYKNPTKRLGLCGIAITAHDVVTPIDIALKKEGIDYATNQIVLIGEQTDTLRNGDKLIPMLNYDGRDILPSYIDPLTRRYVFNLARAVDSFRIVLPCRQGQMFTLTGIYLGNRGNGFSYHSIGVNGASLGDYLRCPYFCDDLRLLRPDLVIFGIGINDAAGPSFDSVAFHDKYLQLTREIRQVNPDCAFIFITNNDSYRRTGRRSSACNTHAVTVQRIMYRLAEETQGAVWDQFAIMGGLRSMTQWRTAQLGQRDRVHFTRAGYQLMGDLLSNALFEAVNYHADNMASSAGKDAGTAMPSNRHQAKNHN